MLSYKQVIGILSEELPEDCLVISGAGFISRELCNCWDRPENLYIQGAMGLAASVGLGISLAQPDKHIVILDGDGGTLMHLGTLATVGNFQPKNYLHIVLDNECHASTGGQPTATLSISLAMVAQQVGYCSIEARNEEELQCCVEVYTEMDKPLFVCVKVSPTIDRQVPRPSLSMSKIARRFSEAI